MTPFSRPLALAWQWAVSTCVATLIAATVHADSPRVVQLEEHWELRLGEPDSDLSAPQTTMVVSPDGDLDDVHFLFALNHSTVPAYAPGGLQVQAWEGDQLLDHQSADEVGALSHGEEVVRWVQRLTLDGTTLSFQVLDGASETWGSFGGDDLSLSVETALTSLNSYRPGVSITESQVSYAENRVQSLTLTKLVWITDDGEVHEMNAPIAVDTSLDP
jgi:hypothetical protein